MHWPGHTSVRKKLKMCTLSTQSNDGFFSFGIFSSFSTAPHKSIVNNWLLLKTVTAGGISQHRKLTTEYDTSSFLRVLGHPYVLEIFTNSLPPQTLAFCHVAGLHFSLKKLARWLPFSGRATYFSTCQWKLKSPIFSLHCTITFSCSFPDLS